MNTLTTRNYLTKGSHIKELRSKYNIGFMEFCRRSGLSTRTLANVEKSDVKIIQDETMTKIMRWFNFTRRGLRKKLLPVDKVAEGSYSISNPLITNTRTTSTKLTIYLNKHTHRGVEAYAHQYGCSRNQAVVQVLKNQFHIVEEDKVYERYNSSFNIIGREGI